MLREVEASVRKGIEELGAKEWEWVLTACSCLLRAQKGRCSNVTAAWFERGSTGSSRMALVMVGRVADEAERRRCGRIAFARYEGGDAGVLRGAAGCELGRKVKNDVDWEFVCRLSRLGKNVGVEVLWTVSASEMEKVPRKIAERVLEESGEHCEQLVAVCEQSLAMEVAGGADKVADVAERDEWFAPHPG